MIYLKTSVGIEIRQDDLVISCLQTNFSKGAFTHFGRIAAYRTRDKAEVRSEIERFFKENRLGRENIVLGLPRNDLIVRHLELPIEVADNLKQVIQYQVQSFEPTEEDKFYFDYVLAKRGQDSNNRLLVLVVMIRKSILDGHLKLLAEFGIKPVTVTGSTMGLSNVFLHTCKETQGKTFLLVDVRSNGIEIIALRDGALVYTNESALRDGQQLKDAIVSGADRAAAKIRLKPEETIDRLALCGEGCTSAQEELAGAIDGAEILGGRIGFEMSAPIRPHVHEAAASLGLAYTGIVRRPILKLNLLPSELRVKGARWAYFSAAALGIAVLLVLIGFFFRPIIQDRTVLKELDKEIAALKPSVDRVQSLRSQADRLQQKITYVEGQLRNRDMNLEVLRELTTLFPTDTYLTSYQNQDGTITINGLSLTVEALVPKLEGSPLLKDVVQTGQTYKDPQSGKDRFVFRAKLER